MKHTKGLFLSSEQLAHIIMAHMVSNNLDELKIYPNSIKLPDHIPVNLELHFGEDEKGTYVVFNIVWPKGKINECN